MHLPTSAKLNTLCDLASSISLRFGQYFVGVDHLLMAMIERPDNLPIRYYNKHVDNLMAVLQSLDSQSWECPPIVQGGEVFYTPRAIRVLSRASDVAKTYKHSDISGAHVLLALLKDKTSEICMSLETLNLGRKEMVEDLHQSLLEMRDEPVIVKSGSHAKKANKDSEGIPVRLSGKLDEPDFSEKDVLDKLTRDLTALARSGKLDPVIGRDQEIYEVLQILARKNKGNVIILGEAGVGKTQLVEGLALQMSHSAGDSALTRYQIFELNIAALMSGTQYRGIFEEKINALLENLRNSEDAILFIDEIHLIMGTGSTDGDSIDIANLLKPVLARGEIKCIGATTYKEYRKFVAKDPALERRFQVVRLEELNENATMEVLKRVSPSLEKHHGVILSTKTLEAAIKYSQRYMPDRNLPDKALDILDQACARYRLKKHALHQNPALLQNTIMPTSDNRVHSHEVRKVVSQLTGIPLQQMSEEERVHLTDLDRIIQKRLIGQPDAVAKAVGTVKKSRAGLSSPNRPDASMLFLGPSGVGKTQLAKLLAEQLFGSENHLHIFDMSQFVESNSVAMLLGAPPGYVGHEEEGLLTTAIMSAPFSILVFDEIEKAHPKIFDVFLPMLDEGRLKDAHGRKLDFRNTIIIFTSNIGADALMQGEADDSNNRLMKEVQQHFRTEFINRIDEIIPFYPLTAQDVYAILTLELKELSARLLEKNIKLSVDREAFKILAQSGYSPQFGVRELKRTVDKLLTVPLSSKILKDNLPPGTIVSITAQENALHFSYGN